MVGVVVGVVVVWWQRTISLSLNVLVKSLFLLGWRGEPSPGANTPWTCACLAVLPPGEEGCGCCCCCCCMTGHELVASHASDFTKRRGALRF